MDLCVQNVVEQPTIVVCDATFRRQLLPSEEVSLCTRYAHVFAPTFSVSVIMIAL